MINDNTDASGGYFTYTFGKDYRDNGCITMRYTPATKAAVQAKIEKAMHIFRSETEEATIPS